MDQKSWLWKKKSTEKTLVSDKASISLSKDDEEEVTEVCLFFRLLHWLIISFAAMLFKL